MITLPQLKEIVRQHNLHCSYMNKDEIIAMLLDKQLITTSDLLKTKFVEKKQKREKNQDVNPKYAYLKGIRTNPKTVEVRDLKTDIVTVYPSTYRVRRELCISPSSLKDGKTWKKRYEIKIK